MHSLFVYGTLMFPQVCEEVIGRSFHGIPAELHGYECRKLTAETYPGIVPASGTTVSGLLWTDVDDVSLTRIDKFEGTLYKRESVSVTYAGGRPGKAFVYVIRPRYCANLSAETWDPLIFEKTRLKQFLATYAGPKYG